MFKFIIPWVFFTALYGVSNIPAYIAYHTTSEEINRKAMEKIKDIFIYPNESFDKLLLDNNNSNIMLIGTFLSQDLLSKPTYLEENFITINTDIPLDEIQIPIVAKSIGVQTAQQKRDFLKLFQYYTAYDENMQIRKLTPEELMIIWIYIGWDIEEPIFLVELDGHKLVLDFDNKGEHLFWMEDIASPCFSLGVNDVKTACYCSKIVDAKVRFIKKNECKEENIAKRELNGAIQAKQINLLSQDKTIFENIAVAQVANFIKTMEYQLSKITLSNFAEKGELMVDVTLHKLSRPTFKIAVSGEVNPQTTDAVNSVLDTLPELNTKEENITFQVYFTVGN